MAQQRSLVGRINDLTEKYLGQERRSQEQERRAQEQEHQVQEQERRIQEQNQKFVNAMIVLQAVLLPNRFQ